MVSPQYRPVFPPNSTHLDPRDLDSDATYNDRIVNLAERRLNRGQEMERASLTVSTVSLPSVYANLAAALEHVQAVLLVLPGTVITVIDATPWEPTPRRQVLELENLASGRISGAPQVEFWLVNPREYEEQGLVWEKPAGAATLYQRQSVRG